MHRLIGRAFRAILSDRAHTAGLANGSSMIPNGDFDREPILQTMASTVSVRDSNVIPIFNAMRGESATLRQPALNGASDEFLRPT